VQDAFDDAFIDYIRRPEYVTSISSLERWLYCAAWRNLSDVIRKSVAG
jgi:hypothetical protein